jgi:putative PIG3 family NAD(P)H quinone oxidoreductase
LIHPVRVISFHSFGDADQLFFAEAGEPMVQAHQILVKVRAAALNRADILQRRGMYPPPVGESPLLGLEMAGEIVVCGEKVTRWQPGDKVCGLIAGGGYAEYAVIHEQHAMSIPEGLTFTAAAAIPEAFLTAWQALHWHANIKKGQRVLLHAAASGVGTAAIQLIKKAGAEVIAVTSAEKHPMCIELGASECIDYKRESFSHRVEEMVGKGGVDIIIDFIGASHWEQNLACLGTDGIFVLLGLLGGADPQTIPLQKLLLKGWTIKGSTLRSREVNYKSRLIEDLVKHTWDDFAEGRLIPVVGNIFPWEEVKAAHRLMESNTSQGKIILTL